MATKQPKNGTQREIKKVAVIGSGVMGAAIAAHIANAGYPVQLLDIVPEGASDRNQLAKTAIERLLKSNPAGFSHPRNAKRITPGNLEDDLASLSEVDWIVEAIVERLDIKQSLYHKLEAVRRPGTVVSSNTSTLPLSELTKDMPKSFAQDFLITHFFNPPRYMPLLELVGGPETHPETLNAMRRFADIALGKTVVDCKDTPGFIANRIGCYWLVVGLCDAIRLGISVEEADAVMGRPVGIPKTGVFGLYDLIGIDLMPLIAKSMLATLPKSDRFREIYEEPALITNLIKEGYTGRKGKGGFYRLRKDGDKKIKEVLDLKTGEYRTEQKPQLASVEAAKAGLAALVTHQDIGGQYAARVLAETLAYAASLIPEIADDIASVDAAMRTGYNWKYGPFELIDRLGGAQAFAQLCTAQKLPVPALITEAGSNPLYKTEGTQLFHIGRNATYTPHIPPEGAWTLADIKRGHKPITKNASAALWDIGDGIACLELTSKMNSIDPDILSMFAQTIEIVGNSYKGLVIGSDADNFSVGANLQLVLFGANTAAWEMLESMLAQGQEVFSKLKFAPFPAVSALAGMAFGGGCEINLHCDAIQAHLESYIGLVEVGVGVIPGWGGCNEMLLRAFAAQAAHQLPGGPMPVISKIFEMIATAKVSASAEEARDMGILRPTDGITMNRRRLLADAKARCLQLAENYTPPEPQTLALPGLSGKAALEMAIEGFAASGKATPYDVVVANHLASVLTGGDTDITTPITESDLLALERKHFVQLLRDDRTLARIDHMLTTSKPLRN